MREHGPARCRPCVAVSRKHGNAHCAPGPSPRVRAFPARLGWAQPKRATDRGHAPAAADGRQCRRQEMLRLRVRAGPIALPVGARGGSTPCLGAASSSRGSRTANGDSPRVAGRRQCLAPLPRVRAPLWPLPVFTRLREDPLCVLVVSKRWPLAPKSMPAI